MAIVKVQYADHHEWIDSYTNRLQSPDLWTPALVVYSTNYQAWFQNGAYHREYDLPAIIFGYGREEWWIRGYRYRLRENGPAIMFNEPSGTIDPTPDQYWYWDVRTDAQGNNWPGFEDAVPPPWVFWEGALSDAELGIDKDYPLPGEGPTLDEPVTE